MAPSSRPDHLRQGGKPICGPAGMGLQQRQAGSAGGPRRQRHHHRTGTRVDPQRGPGEPGCTGASAPACRRQEGGAAPAVRESRRRGPLRAPRDAAVEASRTSSIRGSRGRTRFGRRAAPDQRGGLRILSRGGPGLARRASRPVDDVMLERSGDALADRPALHGDPSLVHAVGPSRNQRVPPGELASLRDPPVSARWRQPVDLRQGVGGSAARNPAPCVGGARSRSRRSSRCRAAGRRRWV